MRAYPMDLRARVPADLDDGVTATEAADAHRVSPARVRRLAQRRREAGEVAPRTGRPGPAPALATHADRLRALVRDYPGLTAGEYRDRLGGGVAVLTAWRALRRLGLTRKKSPPGGRAGPAGGGRRAGGVAGRGDAPAGPGGGRVR
jgi:transposase